ncbi:MAG: NAD-dependent epimerase/dehydratase family protein [Thermomicrobiales bacterium]|jgi:nucleoside-diphosphate-sugar epimerase
MKIFVAGATGAIGRQLLPLLVAAGHEVAGATRVAAKDELIRSLGATPVIVNVFDRSALIAAVVAARPDVVIHQLTDLAGHDFAGNTRIRIEGTRNLVDAAQAAGVRRVIAQSLAFAYAPGAGPAREDEPLDLDAPESRRRTVVGVQALEEAVAALPEGVSLRYGLLYGPGTWYAPDGEIADQVRRGALVANASVSSFVHVEDAAGAALAALDWPAGAVNIVDDEPAPATVWLPVYAAALGAPAPPTATGQDRAARGASNAKARHELGWQPRYPTWRIGFGESVRRES